MMCVVFFNRLFCDGSVSVKRQCMFDLMNAFLAPSFKPKEAVVSIVFCCMAQSTVSTVA